jgi:hypothetical protein
MAREEGEPSTAQTLAQWQEAQRALVKAENGMAVAQIAAKAANDALRAAQETAEAARRAVEAAQDAATGAGVNLADATTGTDVAGVAEEAAHQAYTNAVDRAEGRTER